jgi:hypothetical protein
MNVFETVNRLKVQLFQAYNLYGQLSHPEVVKISQQLDQALNELELKKKSLTIK